VKEMSAPKSDVKTIIQDNWKKYASYVILERAIPDMDGLKPVQRRILETLYKMDDGKLHKVANVAGQTMALHPHGDSSIIDALVNLANHGFLLDRQGNFGNLFTGDPAAAARYIETRLSTLAKETLFNKQLTEFVPSYDGRAQEPVVLPAKIPLLLMQGAQGIAVGMSTSIFPHNFAELLQAQIDILNGKKVHIVPDFPTGGCMDPSEYKNGKGKVKLRVHLEIPDSKTIVIKEICYGTNTESLIRSIDEAAKKGKIKIESIHDYTAEKVEIEIKMPRGHYAKDLLPALYAFTECEVSLHSNIVVVHNDVPIEPTVLELLEYNTEKLQFFLKKELELEKERLQRIIFLKTLEQVFVENRLYKKIEELDDYEKIHKALEKSLDSYLIELSRVPSYEDREHLLNMAIRRITLYDVQKNRKDIAEMGKLLKQVLKDLKNIKEYAIAYINHLIKKFAAESPRRTKIVTIDELDLKAIVTKEILVGFDPKTGYLGLQVKGETEIPCTNFDKLLLFYDDGTYRIMQIPEKEWVHKESAKVIWAGVADKKRLFFAIYQDPKSKIVFGKSFCVKQFILDREYRFIEEGMRLEHFTLNGEEVMTLKFVPKSRQKVTTTQVSTKELKEKGVAAKGIRMAAQPVQKVIVKK
jgi:topoisomerase IV subunit A